MLKSNPTKNNPTKVQYVKELTLNQAADVHAEVESKKLGDETWLNYPI
ncbi:hypothetical protein BGP_0030 [Beggiatoa sp. PS]|nr:hypothetical protein BGP_0030 [Beggiatoa sp. PS]